MTDIVFADDLTLLADYIADAEKLLHQLDDKEVDCINRANTHKESERERLYRIGVVHAQSRREIFDQLPQWTQ